MKKYRKAYSLPVLLWAGILLMSNTYEGVATISRKKLLLRADTTQQDSSHYYLDIKARHRNKSAETYVLQDTTIYFKLVEHYAEGTLQLRLYATKGENLIEQELTKQKGINFYHLNLFDHGIKWKEGDFYVLEIEDTPKTVYSILFQIGDIPIQPSPDAEIKVNPIEVQCDADGNLVKFLGEIDGGRAPYEIVWKVSDDVEGEQLRYEPLKATVKKGGKVPEITVTDPIGYFVIFEVTDNCGKEGKQIAQVECQEQDNEVQFHFEFLEENADVTN